MKENNENINNNEIMKAISNNAMMKIIVMIIV